MAEERALLRLGLLLLNMVEPLRLELLDEERIDDELLRLEEVGALLREEKPPPPRDDELLPPPRELEDEELWLPPPREPPPRLCAKAGVVPRRVTSASAIAIL